MTLAQKTPVYQQAATPRSRQELCRIADSLACEDLSDLIEGEILGLRIPEYYPQHLCRRFASRLIENPRFGFYRNPGAENLGRLGMAYFEIENDSYRRQQYYSQAIPDIRASRQVFYPNWSPLDRLRLDLQEVWPFGANLENIENNPMFVGLVRALQNNAIILPHQDILRRDAPNSPRAQELKTQLGANIYLQTARGGELEIWRKKASDRMYENLRIPGSYGLNRMRLGSPDLTIKPENGDLILFDSTNVHAVAAVYDGVRVSISCFIGYRGDRKPLSFWS